jgi:hypothetical protein
MKVLALVLLCLLPGLALAQSRTVLPEELELTVTVEETEHVPFVREMVLLTIHGVYRRHITREELIQPGFEGFSWTQLGADVWREERMDGQKVKTMTRRMAVYPDRAGDLTIGAFTHKLTLTDEGDEWFEHEIRSDPVTVKVAPAPPGDAWWFPVKNLRISDQWSNAPDQLERGEGVLRVIRLEALGVTPEMIPPMPELTSPSGMIFPHPDKRLVELSPQGPITYAFWRWTIRPGNDTSAVVEPLTLEYYNTHLRAPQQVTISAQRVAYGDVLPRAGPPQLQDAGGAGPVRLPGWPMAGLAAIVFAAGLAAALAGRRITGWSALHRFSILDPLGRALQRAARSGDASQTRRCAARIIARDGASDARRALLADLDAQIFDPAAREINLAAFARNFTRKSEARDMRPRLAGM